MNIISGRNLTWVFGLATGTAIAYLANKTSRTLNRLSKKEGAGYRNSIKLTRHLYDDSEVHYV